MESLSTDNLMRLQVEQLEKEKKELNERMRILAKRLDHIERAYRKEERPLLAKDYEQQQANDRAVFEQAQKARIEAHRQAHLHDIETKKRLTRMLNDFNKIKEAVSARRGEEFAKMKEDAQHKMEEEKAKRRAAVLKTREEERLRQEEEERIRQEEEEEAARLEAGELFVCCVVRRADQSSQNVSPSSSARKRRKRLLVLPRSRRSGRKRSVWPLSASRERRSVSKLWKLPVGSNSARRRLFAGKQSARQLRHKLQRRAPPLVCRSPMHGVAPVLRPHLVPELLPRLGLKAPPLPQASTDPALSVVLVADGVHARRRSSRLPPLEMLLPHDRLLLLSSLLRRRNLPRTPTGSRPWRRRTSGGLRASVAVTARRRRLGPAASSSCMLCAGCVCALPLVSLSPIMHVMSAPTSPNAFTILSPTPHTDAMYTDGTCCIGSGMARVLMLRSF